MDTGLTPFFIIGLPRSRTLWFSELFSFSPVFCAHEHFSDKPNQSLIADIRGYSDTNPLQPYDYGDSPVLIIERDKADVIESIYRAFDKPKGIVNYYDSIKNYITVYHEALEQLQPKNALRVKFEDINDRLEEIWRFLLPDIEPDQERTEYYKNRVIKTTNRLLESALISTFGSMDAFIRQYDSGLLNVVRITDFMIAKRFVLACWDEISEDNAPDYMPDVINEYWLALTDGERWIGCYRLHQIYAKTWQGHVFMLPSDRKRYTDMGCISVYHWVLDNIDFNKIITMVPSKYTNVMAFLERSGFDFEGINRQAFTKDGKLWDVHYYGITRDKMKEHLTQWLRQRQL